MFKIECSRSAAPVFGAATSFAKNDEGDLVWYSRAAAVQECARLTTLVGMSSNVSYRVVELDDVVDHRFDLEENC